MAFVWDRAIVAFLAVGGLLVALAAVGGHRWFGPGWMVFAALGVTSILAGLAMAYTQGPKPPQT